MPTTETLAQSIDTPLEGVKAWTNVYNRFRVVEVRYTADPEKRSQEWILANKSGMPDRGWKREYEINWSCPAGEPVIPEFDPNVHVRPLLPLRGCRIVRGWDPGFVSPSVVIGQVSVHGQLLILNEVCPFNTTLDSLIPMVKSATIATFPDPSAPFDAGDPASDAETALGNILKTMRTHGIHLSINRPGTEESYDSLRSRMMKMVYIPGLGHQPAFFVHPRCKTLIAALSGAFSRSPHPPYSPIKTHPYKDIVDALRYLNDNLQFSNRQFQSDLRSMATVDRVW